MRVQNVYSPAGNTTYSEVTGTDGNNIRNTRIKIHAGNRTRAARVAGEHSTTEPPMRVQSVYSPAGNTTYSEVTGTDGNNIKTRIKLHRPGIEPGPPAWPEHSTTEPPMRVQSVYSPAGNTTYSEVTGTDGKTSKPV
ncbi:hypothetical protein RB195_012308 [Necator americanus]|uniref:Uncharacterized protein n=1 Tax=Necator americanus TaxID=51031 RepID=A0ABR1D7B3_NECAM